MSLFLHIDTAISSSSICVSEGANPKAWKFNPETRDSASWLHVAIKQLLHEQQIQLKDLRAISVSAGPGSYTGLRVGMATAKGLCYALNIPLITISTLKIMASAARNEPVDLLCPMIDARRMEVFTALYDKDLHEVMPPVNMILDETSFQSHLQHKTICFFGNGSEKAKPLLHHTHASFAHYDIDARQLCPLVSDAYSRKDFADLAYSVPIYVKDFYTAPPRTTLR